MSAVRERWGESAERARCPITNVCEAYCDEDDWMCCPVVRAAKRGGWWGAESSRGAHGTIDRYVSGCRCDKCLRAGGELKGRRSKWDR